MTFYTAIGNFGTEQTRDGRHVVITNNGESKLLDISEMVIWATLSYRLLEFEGLEKLYQTRIAALGVEGAPPCGAYIDRLLQRGLIAEGHGERGHDALYDLLSELYIVPVPIGLFERIAAFFRQTFAGRMPLGLACRLLRKPKMSSSEREIMGMCAKVRLSVAEVICCVENGHHNLASDEDVMDALYSDEYTTSDNISSEARVLRCETPCLVNIANLYLRQCIVLEK